MSTPAAPSAQSQHPQIDCGGGHGPEVIRGVQDALCEGKIPFTYVADGRAVAVQAVTGSPDADGSRPLPVAVTALEPALLKSMLARFTFTFRWVPSKVPGAPGAGGDEPGSRAAGLGARPRVVAGPVAADRRHRCPGAAAGRHPADRAGL